MRNSIKNNIQKKEKNHIIIGKYMDLDNLKINLTQKDNYHRAGSDG